MKSVIILMFVFNLLAPAFVFAHGFDLPSPTEYKRCDWFFNPKNDVIDCFAEIGASASYLTSPIGYIVGTVLIGPFAWAAFGFHDTSGFLIGGYAGGLLFGRTGNYVGQFVLGGPPRILKFIFWDCPKWGISRFKKG